MSLIVLSNRAPYQWSAEEGFTPSVGGLTAALDPVLTAQGGVWLAHAPGVPETTLPPGQSRYRFQNVDLDSQDAELHYHGLSNGALWPLCHGFLDKVTFESSAWEAYQRVNQAFAQAALDAHQAEDLI